MRAASWSSSAMSPTLTGSEAPRLRRALGGTNPLSRYPRAYLFLARRRYGSRVLGPDTDIVIEGFPRSANTFAVTAFELAQERPVTVAHHLHAAAHVVRAAQAGVPVIVLVRAPEDAIASVVARKPSLAPEAAAAAYLRFYEGVAGVLDALRCRRVPSGRRRLRRGHRAHQPRVRDDLHAVRAHRRERPPLLRPHRGPEPRQVGRPAGRVVGRPPVRRARPAGRGSARPRRIAPRRCARPGSARVYDATVERATP